MINVIDTALYNVIFSMSSVPATVVMTFFSFLGSATVLIAVATVLLIIMKNKKVSILISLNLILVFVLNRVLKLIFARPRPNALRLAEETGFSFPSGHAMVALGFYGLLIYILNKKIQNKKQRVAVTTALSVLVLMIGISRVYLGVHYATDIIGGFIFGLIYLWVFIKFVYKRFVK